MKKINLRDYYPHNRTDFYLEVSDEIVLSFQEFDRLEHAYQMRRKRHKAYYSLDRDDGIEGAFLFVSSSPDELYERKIDRQGLYAAISSLPDKQAKRIYAHFFMDMSISAIAKTERVDASSVRESITRGLRNIETFLKNC